MMNAELHRFCTSFCIYIIAHEWLEINTFNKNYYFCYIYLYIYTKTYPFGQVLISRINYILVDSLNNGVHFIHILLNFINKLELISCSDKVMV